MEPPHYKIITLGSYGVGKTCILLKACDSEARLSSRYQCTIGVDFKTKVHSFKNQKYKFAIWDTAGQERFQTINRLYYKDTDAVFLVFDLTNRASFERINSLLDDFRSYSGSPCVSILIGNKNDKPLREIQDWEVTQMANQLQVPFLYCSAFTGENIDKIFDILIEQLSKKAAIKKNFESIIIRTEILKKGRRRC
jgi:small GTP-binding protein